MLINKSSLVVLAALVSMTSMACTTLYQQQTIKMPKSAKVGVILTDKDGDKLEHTAEKNYIYSIMMTKGLIPVAINDVDVTKIVSDGEVDASLEANESNAKVKLTEDPATISAMQEHFKEKDIEFVLILWAHAFALDKDLRAILIRVDDMSVVGAKFYKYRIVAPLCTGLSFALGLSILVCPWMAFKNKDEAIYEQVEDLIDEMTK